MKTFADFERYIESLIEDDQRPCPFCGRPMASMAHDWYDEEGPEAGIARPTRVYWCEPD